MTKKLTYIILYLLIVGITITCTKEEVVPVSANFDIDVVDNDYSIPVQVMILNKSEEADTYEWTFEGGSPASSTKRNPGIILYETKGEYTIRLYAANKDGSEDEHTMSINIDAPVVVDFTVEVVESNYPPLEVNISNNTTGASSYKWEFEGGIPSSSTEKDPPTVVFPEPGEYTIRLEVSNGLETYDMETTVLVEQHLSAGFEWEVNFDDDDHQVPVHLTMQNHSTSATNFLWTFENGVPATSIEENPEVTFNTPGIHNITLMASNGKKAETLSKQIEVYPDTNLRVFEDVVFGINTSHNNNVNGSFFSTHTRQSYTQSEVTEENSSLIDIIFFGLNDQFILNKFVSPDATGGTTFQDIHNATHTKFINSQELCNCGASLSTAEFDTMSTDALLQNLTIVETADGLEQFTSDLVPRIVLFENSHGLKGAIKIKEFVQNGQDSYIITDIKVQKEVK